jgi:hypothetical protein
VREGEIVIFSINQWGRGISFTRNFWIKNLRKDIECAGKLERRWTFIYRQWRVVITSFYERVIVTQMPATILILNSIRIVEAEATLDQYKSIVFPVRVTNSEGKNKF